MTAWGKNKGAWLFRFRNGGAGVIGMGCDVANGMGVATMIERFHTFSFWTGNQFAKEFSGNR